MSSINQLVSEIAHSVNQADSVPVRRAIKLGIIHARNELIRKSYGNHNYTDKVLQQRVRLELINVPDGDIEEAKDLDITNIKRTKNKVPKPIRLTNNLPFHSVRTVGVESPVEICYVKEASSRFYKALPGFCPMITYDYINGYIYINTTTNTKLKNINYIIVESVFEYPHIINTETVEGIEQVNDDEFLLPEDLVGAVKKLVLETFIPEIIKDTNEIHKDQIVK